MHIMITQNCVLATISGYHNATMHSQLKRCTVHLHCSKQRCTCLVPVVIRLEWTSLVEAEILGLLIRQLCQVSIKAGQV